MFQAFAALGFSIFLSMLACSDGHLKEQQDSIEKIDEFVEEFLDCLSIPGLSLSAVHNGEVVISKGYGKADLELDIDVTSSTRFGIASTTKAFTAVLLSQLLSEHPPISWNTPVRDIIGDWFYFSDGYRSNTTTLRDVLAHKMGVAGHDFIWIFDQWSTEELVERIRFLEPVFPFRNKFVYNNLMYAVAGYAAQQLSEGTIYEDLLIERVFEPLGMDLSTITYYEAPEFEGFAIPYTGPRGPNRFPAPWELYRGDRSIAAAGAIVSTADDMAKWLNFLLGHAGDTNPPLDVEAARQTFQPEIQTLLRGNHRPEYQEGLNLLELYDRGWFDGYYKGYRVVSHDGAMDGYYTQVSIMPDMDIGIFTSMNFRDILSERQWIHAYIMDVIMGYEPWFNASDICPGIPLPDDSPPPKHIQEFNEAATKRSLEHYIGVYGNFAYGNITIYQEGNTDILLLQYGNSGYYDLLPTETEDVFNTSGNRPPADYLDIGEVIFASSNQDDIIDMLTIPSFSALDPPLFIRDLQYADAPPPSLERCDP